MDEGTTRSSVLDERLRDPTQITWPRNGPQSLFEVFGYSV
jgi:hypothetical protein